MLIKVYLNGLNRVIHFDDAESPTLAVLVLGDFGKDDLTGQSKHFAQFTIVHLVVELQKQSHYKYLQKVSHFPAIQYI